MVELSLLQLTSPFVIAILVLALVMLFFWIGHRIRKKAIEKDPEHANADIKPINGLLIGLLGLLLAFTFSMSNSRYDDRRRIVIEEANIIGTTILRADMYPDSIRTVLRSTLKEYVERRIEVYQAGMDIEKGVAAFQAGQAISTKLWRIAVDYSKKDDVTTRTAQLIPSINEMIDITSTRLAANVGTIPDSIMYFLFFLCVGSSFLLGYDLTGKVDWIIVTGFALTLSATVFSIVDLDRPRSGLITTAGPNQMIIELRQMFKE